MFHDLPDPVVRRMRALEQRDAEDRADGTPRTRRLRQVPPDTGRFLSLMAASAPAGVYLEIGTSAGYSALWISLACRRLGRELITVEVDPAKASIARETFREAQVEDLVRLVVADAREMIPGLEGISFCFLDTEKELYGECYDLVVPRMTTGGLLLADNAVDFREVLQPMLERAHDDPRVDSLIVPIGKGVLLCRRI
jgi:predicted O-methyltransferase YrrM